ncbi:MAG: Re/Si-specific NAD(P)(+) transhydrogenase subunit alpha [Arenicellales bacterium]|jgi:NAD(P) transhydrogenase subunit alpha|nr:Re/Si-specific NAD(P)(+) transhydrogenase subunit alpha [Arenicellales bacterium]MDP6791781.1 Re/Si-specific NAD(P)(+) transhydrogenase subunit alpha [Arenicellales bacterium]MDP6918566.1 Re/Si-specific NAD(P)(+) transhydrogenase subunit alpha [Arenicellales bacterium]|tara:strand:- start:17115 stop:18680 length:1566 start_codon:yes stop_codon:yes gene_type:complete
MIIGIPTEQASNEKRVALSPASIPGAINLGLEVHVESGAGSTAGFSDADYRDQGAVIVDSTDRLYQDSDVIIKVRAPLSGAGGELDEFSLLGSGKTLISLIGPGQNPDLLERLAQQSVTTLAMDAVPRISRAQKLDTLSSMANVAGYRAVVEAANHFGRFFTGQVTAAGKVPPAKVLVIGAGVAGLAAIGAATAMGAVVRAFDTRPEVKEQVESMGAEFLMLDFDEEGSGEGGYAKVMSEAFIAAEMKLFEEQARDVDIIITTALVPGKPAPKLILAGTARLMRAGSVIVDLAAEQGGNCELTHPGEVVSDSGITVIGFTDLPSRMAAQSSQLYGNNVVHLLTDLCPEKDGQLNIDMEDEVIRGLTVVNGHEVTWPPPPPRLFAAPPAAEKPSTPAPVAEAEPKKRSALGSVAGLIVVIALILGMGAVAPKSFMGHFTVFVLAVFVGWQVIWNVTPALHTPLMSVTNAISGIIVIGALLQMGSASGVVTLLAVIALFVASINIFGGFWVTQRMLRMFRKDT